MENLGWSDFHLQDPIWWNKKVRLKSKKKKKKILLLPRLG